MIHSVLAPLRRLVNDGLFWQYQSDGLALYSRPGWWRALRVPLDLPELAVVADRFHISPLLPLLTGDGHFFVLALSQHQIRLLEGTRDRLEEVHLPGVPLGVRDPLQGREAQKQLQLYVADRGGVAARGIFSGHGSAGDLQKDQVLRYFRKVNRALREVLAGERAPMVLAAVEHLAPLWRQVNTYPHLVDQVLAGSPEELGRQDLHARAWAVVEPRFLQAQGEAAGTYHQLAGSGLTSRDPREIIRAAKEGRVETLFAVRRPAADRRRQQERQAAGQRGPGAARRARAGRRDHPPQRGHRVCAAWGCGAGGWERRRGLPIPGWVSQDRIE
jgi:hypothetical protein